MKKKVWQTILDLGTAIIAGLIVALAYHFFQNSNGFAPGGVGGLATITFHFLEGKVAWAWLMLAFNLPIFVLVSIFVNKKLGLYLILYITVQSLGVEFFDFLGWKP